jgi:hypothetical protein
MTTFKTRCLHCGTATDVPNAYHGREIKCIGCERQFQATHLSEHEFIFRCDCCNTRIRSKWNEVNNKINCPRCASLISIPDPFTLGDDSAPEYKTCSSCSEEVLYEAMKCKHCGTSQVKKSNIQASIDTTQDNNLSRLPDGKFSCPECKSQKTKCDRPIGCAVLVIAFITLGFGLIMILFLPYKCKCHKCGFTWKT